MTKTKKYDYLLKTDASLGDYCSYHGIIFNDLDPGAKKKAFYRHTYTRKATKIQEAERLSIIDALNEAYRIGLENILLETDSESTVNLVNGIYTSDDINTQRDIAFIKNLLGSMKAEIVFVSRERNKGADKMCRTIKRRKQTSLRNKSINIKLGKKKVY